MTFARPNVATLVLCWLARKQRRGGTLSEIVKSMESIAVGSHRTEWKEELSRAMQSLQADALVERNSRGRCFVTASGEQRAAAELAVPKVSERMTFVEVRGRLATLALGLPVATAVTPEGLRTAVLSRHLQLAEPARSLNEIKNALAWRQLGVESVQPFHRRAVLESALRAELGRASKSSESQAFAQLAARAVGARRTTAEELRTALLSRWLQTETSQTGRPVAGAEDGPASTEELTRFSEAVVALAKATREGRFGDRLIFLAALFRRAREATPPLAAELPAFRERLLAGHNAGLLTLSRADLVEAMDPADVRASEIDTGTATFHFLRIPQ